MKHRAGPWALLVSILIGLLSGCGRMQAKDVAGTYVVSYPYGTDRIVLQPDGRYAQSFTFGSGKVLRSTGKWELVKNSEMGNAVFLGNAWHVYGSSEARHVTARGERLMPVRGSNPMTLKTGDNDGTGKSFDLVRQAG